MADEKQPALFGDAELERHRREVADEELSAWVDGELDRQAAARLERQIEADPELRARADEFRALHQSLRELPPPPRTEARVAALRARVLGAVEPAVRSRPRWRQRSEREADVDNGVIGSPPGPIRARSWIAPAVAALAAGLAVYFLIPGPTTTTPPPDPEAELAAASFETATEEELALALTFETFSPEDYDVVANLELLELLDDLDAPEGGSG